MIKTAFDPSDLYGSINVFEGSNSLSDEELVALLQDAWDSGQKRIDDLSISKYKL